MDLEIPSGFIQVTMSNISNALYKADSNGQIEVYFGSSKGFKTPKNALTPKD